MTPTCERETGARTSTSAGQRARATSPRRTEDQWRAAAPAVALLLIACQPNLGDPGSLITSTRVLAVRGEPPEAAPNAMVHYDVLVASPDGTVSEPSATWSYCLSPKPPADNNGVGVACLQENMQSPIGGPSASTDAPLPKNACQLFGPEVASPPPGQPPGRPADPDVTGGYYQPVRVKLAAADIDGSAAFGLERITCNLGDAPIDIAQEYGKTYQPNQNPALTGITVDGKAVLEAAAVTVTPGATVQFAGSWTEDSSESYPVYDITALALKTHREALRLSWFATAGRFSHDRTGAEEGDTATTTENFWTAPTKPGVVHFWAVLRDSRGGTDFAAFDVTVGP